MKDHFSKFSERFQTELEMIDLDGCHFSIEELNHIIRFIEGMLNDMKKDFLSIKKLKYENRNLKKKNKEYKKSGILNDADAKRYREMCISQKKKINELKLLLRVERSKH